MKLSLSCRWIGALLLEDMVPLCVLAAMVYVIYYYIEYIIYIIKYDI